MKNYAQKIKGVLENKNIQNYAIVFAIVAMFLIVFSVWPFATDGYEDIYDRATLEQRIATGLANHQETILIDYSGEDWQNLKSWIKEDFRYPVLSQYTDELTIYNYDNAKFTYWTYGEKKRVKITISYKLSVDEMQAVYAFADNLIDSNGLRNKSQYEQILFVHDYLINNFHYNVNENNLYHMIQNNETNCYGYTMMNYVILNRLGIEVRTTYGRMNQSHIWNSVNLNGTWYYEDVTWDTVTKGTDYFLISTSKLQMSHTIEGNFVPNCPTDYVANKTEQNTENTGTEDTETDTIVDVPVDTEDTEDAETVTGDANGEVIEDNSEKTEDSFREEENDSVVADNPSDVPTVPKTEKIQKLTNLLKALKTLKNK